MDVSQVPSARRLMGAASGCQPLNSPQTITCLAEGAFRVNTVLAVFGAGGAGAGATGAGFTGGLGAAATGGVIGLGVGTGAMTGLGVGGTAAGAGAGLGVTTGAAGFSATAGRTVSGFFGAAFGASDLTD